MDLKINQKCAPSKKFINGSCFSLDDLKLIAESYNNRKNSKNKIEISNDKIELVNQLEHKMKKVCDDQTCWLRQDFVKQIESDEIQKNTFKPSGPRGKYEWLSTTNINEVIEQYMSIHKDFIFLGAVPIDFDDLPILGLADLNFGELQGGGKNKFGVVFNLDEHYKNGSHWVALYGDLKKKQVYFFDSYGKKPEKRIRKFVSRVVKYLYRKEYNKDLHIRDVISNFKGGNLDKDKFQELKNFDINYNKVRHQFKNSECGVYSINFILRLLDGQTFRNISINKTYDDKMNNNRDEYFI
jgi:hypothetical protein